MTSSSIKVIVVDDDAFVRACSRLALGQAPDGNIEVVGEACNGKEAIGLVGEILSLGSSYKLEPAEIWVEPAGIWVEPAEPEVELPGGRALPGSPEGPFSVLGSSYKLEPAEIWVEPAEPEVELPGGRAIPGVGDNLVVLMDIDMPVIDGLEATRIIKDRFPLVRVVMYSSQCDDLSVVARAMLYGAEGFLSKPAGVEELVGCVERVFWGPAVDPPVAEHFLGSPEVGLPAGRTLPGEALWGNVSDGF